jgi:tRNA-modifying protein YgfZ
MSQLSALNEVTRKKGAIFVSASGWEMPDHFGDPHAEYRNTRGHASLFDRSFQGKLEVSGPEAPQFLHNLSTNDIENLPLGAGCEAYFCNHTAKVLGHAFIYHVKINGNHALWLDVTPGYHEKVLKHLDKHLIAEQVELADKTMDFVQMHLAGPKAKSILETALGEAIPELGEFQHMERTFGVNATCHIRRSDSLGVPGYDIVCLNSLGEGVWQLLVASGAKPAGLNTFEILRCEAGTPVYGIDIDENRFVMEVARPLRGVSYSKGCYLGQEPIVMARDRAGFVNRTFLGIKVLEGGVLPSGTKLFKDTTEVGLITSCCLSYRLGKPLALGYIRRGHQDPGTRLDADTPNGKVPVEVLGFPPIQ